MLLANGLDALPRLDCAASAREELQASAASALASPWHASRKDAWAATDRLDFDTASRLNHGHVLHEHLMAPFARKVLGRDASHIAAPFHRIPWLPLYWPQTLLGWLDGRPQELPPTVFSHPAGASVADLCASLARRMETSPAVTLRHERLVRIERLPSGFTLQLERSGRVTAERLAWAQTPRQGIAACGASAEAARDDRLPLMLVFLRVPRAALRRDFTVVHAVASDVGLYRVNNASRCAGEPEAPWIRMVAEANVDAFGARHGTLADDAAVVRAVMSDLACMGLIAEAASAGFSHVLRLPGALPLPTANSLAAHAEDHSRLLRLLPGAELLGPSAGPFATSLSDQIVQGLLLADAQVDEPLQADAVAA